MEHIEDATRPLISRILKVPRWRARYLAFVKHLATERLSWKHINKEIKSYDALIRDLVKVDDKCLYGLAAYKQCIAANAGASDPNVLATWVKTRRAFLLKHDSLKAKSPVIESVDGSVKQAADARGSVNIRAKLKKSTSRGVRVFAHVAEGRRGRFIEITMHDDGQHDDGRAGDGVFGASMPLESSKKPRFYVEAFSPKTKASSFYPASTERGATVISRAP